MNFVLNSFYFLLVFNYYIATEEFEEFTFQAMALGHSGLLITWEPIGKLVPCDVDGELCRPNYSFRFGTCVEGMITDDCIRYVSFSESNAGQYKISLLNESTNYEVKIGQFRDYFDDEELKIYSVKSRTNEKTNSIPAKPYFEYFPPRNCLRYVLGCLRWYPCGKGRNCHDKEPGTHFGVHIKELDGLTKASDVSGEQLFKDFYLCLFWPGKLYEIVVYSIHGEYKTYSDTKEIFLQSKFTSVQHVNVLSLPDLSVLISWKPPKHSLETLTSYFVDHFDESIEPNPNVVVVVSHFLNSTRKVPATLEQIRILDLKYAVTYTYSVAPYGLSGLGYEFRMKHTLQVYDDSLPIAEPDFNYKFPNKSMPCGFLFQWLPCGQSFDCKNTKPGSNYSFKIEPKPLEELYQEHGYYSGLFDKSKVYEVTLTSLIGNNVSEPVTKKFKNCSIYDISG